MPSLHVGWDGDEDEDGAGGMRVRRGMRVSIRRGVESRVKQVGIYHLFRIIFSI